jgi:hypothetical protein
MHFFDSFRRRPESDSGGSARRFRRAALASSAIVLLFVATLFYKGPLFGTRLESPSSGENKPILSTPNVDSHPQSNPDFYDWHTRSQFRPVSQAVADKSTRELCNAFQKTFFVTSSLSSRLDMVCSRPE